MLFGNTTNVYLGQNEKLANQRNSRLFGRMDDEERQHLGARKNGFAATRSGDRFEKRDTISGFPQALCELPEPLGWREEWRATQ